MIIYGQRTADGRIAFGGRGAPYHFGSRIEPGFDTDERVRAMLVDSVRELFPVLDDVDVPVPLGWAARRAARLALPRCATTARAGIAVAGGYVGDGVATTNLAGRTLADLITGRRHRHRAPPVGRPPTAAVGAASRCAGSASTSLGGRLAGADAAEAAHRPAGVGGRRAAWTRLLDALTGH